MSKLSIVIMLFAVMACYGQRQRSAELGIRVGTMQPGELNAITDVSGVLVGHTTKIQGDNIRTGVTAVLAHGGNIFQSKVPAAVSIYNAFGKLAGSTQISELGNIETPVILTNTLSVGTALAATVKYTLGLPGNEKVRSVNAVVGETNDGYLNDIRGMHITEDDVINAIKSASGGTVSEGSVGAGTGTRAFGYKGGIGTASRLTGKPGDRRYTVGVLVQSNFGRDLQINGVPFPRPAKHPPRRSGDEGSCMIIIATDAPLSVRNLQRLARRSFAGMARTSTVMSNGSGDFAIAFTTAYRIPYISPDGHHDVPPLLGNDSMTRLFRAAEEATQEAIYNSLFMAASITGNNGRTVRQIPLDRVKHLLH